MPMSKKQLHIQLPANINFAGAIRRFSNSVFDIAGFNMEWRTRLELVVDELFMNAVIYGSNKESEIHIEFNYDEEEINFKIHDEGKGPKKISPEELKSTIQKNAADKNVAKTSGRGLAMIVALWTDHFDVEKSPYGGIAISFNKKLGQNVSSNLSKRTTDLFLERENGFPYLQGMPKTAPLQNTDLKKAINIKVENGTRVSSIEKLDIEIRNTIDSISPEEIVALDLKGITYINSILIGYLVSWYNHVQPKKGYLILKNIDKRVKDILSLVGLSTIFYLDY